MPEPRGGCFLTRQALGARHQRVQRLRRLLRNPKLRQSEGAFVAEGVRVVGAALEAGAPIEAIFVEADGAGQESVAGLASEASRRGIRVFELAPGVMGKVADTVTPQAVCAIVGALEPSIDAITGRSARASGPGLGRVVLVCIDVRDPGNLGAIVRSAGASGAAAVVCCGSSVDPHNPKAVRASAGVIFRLPIVRANDTDRALGELRRSGFRLVGTTPAGGIDYLEADLGGDVALLVGNEASGLPGDLVAGLDARVTIPMAGAESLNVAMTATVLAFEAARRRRPRSLTGSS
jgi:TrmH family RNA methyltransferase